MTLDWQVVLVMLLALVLRVYSLFTQDRGKEHTDRPRLGEACDSLRAIDPSLPARGSRRNGV